MDNDRLCDSRLQESERRLYNSIGGTDDLVTMLEESLVTMTIIRGSPYVGPIKVRARQTKKIKKSESVLSSMLLTIGVEGSIFFLTHWISGLLARESGSIWRAYFLLLTFKGCYIALLLLVALLLILCR